MQILKINHPFKFENGGELPNIEITYHTYGQRNMDDSNVIWICHALTANSDVQDWWSGLVGSNKTIDTNKYFVICANILGSCYGTSGPNVTFKQSIVQFSKLTIRDMVNAHELLREELKIKQIKILIGGSMGGYQALEWSIIRKDLIRSLFLIATSAEESAWGKAIHAAQRMAIESDPNWECGILGKGDKGLIAARSIGMLTYRNYEIFNETQADTDYDYSKFNKAESYLRYQGQKLANRFIALNYYYLSKAMDTHSISRNRVNNTVEILNSIDIPTLVMGISSDILCPPTEQEFLAKNLPNVQYHEINSIYGHDGFLIESEAIGKVLCRWLKEN